MERGQTGHFSFRGSSSSFYFPSSSSAGMSVGSPQSKDELDARRLGNVRRMIWYNAVFSLFSSIAQMTIFDTYLFVKSRDSNSAVGWAESISGLTQICLAIPAGFMADKYSRAGVLRGCAWLSFVAVAVSIVGILNDSTVIIYFSLFLFGAYVAIQNPTSYALFSDSIPQGSRAKYMTQAGIVNQIGFGLGPVLGLGLFRYFGNEWQLPVLHVVLTIGFLGMIPANFLLFGWKDVQGAEEIPRIASSDGTSGGGALSNIRYARAVPYLMCLNDVVTCIGAGMTVKFFPLFFKNDYGFDPVQVQLLFAVYGLTFGVFTWLCERIASRLGRVQAGMLFSCLGVSCLFALAYIEYLPAVIFVFTIRGALQNSIYPIDRSIIMDFVPSNERGRWNAVESISSMSWSGSAVIGGYLVDHHDYRYAFVVTGFIYLLAAFMRTPLLFLVPKNEKFTSDAEKPLLGSEFEIQKNFASPVDVAGHLLASPRSPNPQHFGQ